VRTMKTISQKEALWVLITHVASQKKPQALQELVDISYSMEAQKILSKDEIKEMLEWTRFIIQSYEEAKQRILDEKNRKWA